MFRKIREDKKGFTLAELLIVVAIIGVLVAVSIPIFTAQLRKSKIATNQANARAAYAATVAQLLDEGADTGVGTYTVDKGTCVVDKDETTLSGATANSVSSWTESGKDTIGGFDLGASTANTWQVLVSSGGVQYLPS